MPLFATPEILLRSQTYRDILDSNLLELKEESRILPGDASMQEYQYILHLNSVDEPQLSSYRNILAMSTGKLKFCNAATLQARGWDINTIFGIGRDPTEVFALELVPTEDNSKNYYPGYARLDVRFLYINIERSTLSSFLIPLIRCHVTDEEADTVLPSHAADYASEYFDEFTINPKVSITVNGGETIGRADKNTLTTTDNTFRLSLFYLDIAGEADFTPHLQTYMRFRGRIPDVAFSKTTQPSKSMAGHPIIVKHTGINPGTARVDFTNHALFASKIFASPSLDLDTDPIGIALKKPATAEQAVILSSIGVPFETTGQSSFSVHNPDGYFLKVVVVDETPAGSIQIVPGTGNISSTDLEKTVIISTTQEAQSAKLQVQLTDRTFSITILVLYEVLATPLECRLVPAQSWSLKYTLNSKAKIEPFVLSDVLLHANNRLIERANVYLYAPIAGTKVIDLTQATVPLDTASCYVEVLDALAKDAQYDCNIIWTWDLKPKQQSDEMGEVLPEFTGQIFSNPLLFIEAVAGYSDTQRGIILAHEFCHFVALSSGAPETLTHFQHEPGTTGHWQYSCNLMQRDFADEHLLLTTAQAIIINQNVVNIGLFDRTETQ